MTSAWTRVVIPAATVTNPIIGFRIVTNGDAIDVDYVQHASVEDLLALSDAEFEALLPEDPDELADASLGG